MKKTLIILTVLVIACLGCIFGCSREDRNDAIERAGKIGKIINGEVRPDDKEYDTPNIVKERRRKDTIDKNTKWTPENQAKYPAEYCRAQLEELDKHSKNLDIQSHKYSLAKSKMSRAIGDDELQVEQLEHFLAEAKKAYRDAEASNTWPVAVNGFSLTKEMCQEKVVDAAERLAPLKAALAKRRRSLATIEARISGVLMEQKKIASIRDRIQVTLSDLEVKEVIGNEQSITDSLNAITDSLSSLSMDSNDPSLDELIVPNKEISRQKRFDEIMAE